MRLSNLTDEDLERSAAGHLKSVEGDNVQPGIKAAQDALASVFHELLDRRREDELRKRTTPAIKLAIAHVELMRNQCLQGNNAAALACLDMQLTLLKEYDEL